MALQLSLNVAGLQDAQVGPDVQKIGVSFRSFPPEPVVINSVMPETWGQGRFQGGEEVVAVNGIDVATMDRDAFREALQVRPLTIRFRVPAQDQLDSVVAEKGVEKIGLVFQQLPPAPVIVSKVQEGSWAAQQGFEGGEEIVMVNGKELSQMSADDFKKALKEERPLALRFRPRELPDGVEELVAEKEVGKIGLSFLKMPPEPVIVNKVIPGCWAEEVGFQGGEEIVALDGAPVASMTPETFKAALQQRPLRLRFRPAGHKEQEEQEEEEEDDEEPVEVTADAKVKKIGLSFRELPPQPVVVSKVVPETWASQMGFRGGEEIVALNGQPCEAMNSATFKELLGIRPLTLRYFPPLEAEPEEPAELHEREAAATKIQALHRGKTARAAVAAQKEERINAATKIQAVQRGNRERKAVAEDKSRRAASIAPESPATPQTPATAARPRPPAAPPAIPRPPATPSPKKKKRQDPVRPNVPDLDVQKREEAAKRIQAVQRGKAARTATAVERQQREDAATKIQAVQRGKAARRATADEKQHREEAAKKIQAVQRGKAARAATADEKQQREDAATKIQAVQRGKAARRATADEKRQREDAATKIQAVQRGKAARLAAEKDLTAPRKQSPVKQDVSDLDAQEREEAAKKIQAVHRGKAARRATADEKQQREDAAKKIQAVQRGKAAQSAAAKPRIKPEKALKAPMKEERGKKTAPAEPRKQAPGKQDVTDLDAQEREEAAKKIQAVQRGKAARTAMAEEKQQREAAATKIQAVQRGKAARMAGTDKKTESKETSGSRRSREKGPGSVGPSEASGARGTKGDEPKGRGKGTPGPDRRSVQSVRSTRSASAGASHSSQRAQARKEKAEAKEAKKAQDAAAAAAAAEPGSVTPSAEPRSPRSPRSPGSTATRRAGSEGSARSGSNSPVHGRGGASRASVISQDRASSSSPRNRQRGSLLSTVSGEADVYLSFKVEGLNQELLSNDVMAQYEDAVKNAILQQAGAGLKNEHLQLRCKKGKVSAKISAPPTVPRAMLHSCLANSSGALSTVLASELANIPDLAHEDIQVTKLELKFGEVSRQSSIILDTRRTFPWPGSKAESAERRVASPRTPRSATPRGRDEAALSRFRTELLRREGSYAAAWRRILDCSGHGYISFAEFCDACRRMNYRGNIKHAWTDLDADGSGKVTLCEIDWATAEALSRFAAALEKSFGSIGQAGKQLGKGGRRLRREEFRSLMMEQGILNQSEVDNIFRMICCNATMARPAVTMKEFEWLSHMIDHLPRPGDRVAPGAETVDLPGTVPGVPCVVAASASPASVVLETSETRTPGSARQRTPSAPLREDAKDLYERLHQEAINYHKRKKAMHEKEGLYRPPGSPAYNTPCKSDAKTLEKIEKLYKTHEVQKKKQEKLTEEYYRQLRGDRPQRREPDEEVWARLQAKKEVKEPKSEAEIEKPRETSNLKYKGPPTRAPPSGNSKEAAERLYAAAKKNESKKKELAGRADQERLEKEEEMKKKMGPITKAREAQLVQRLHQDDHQRREEELKKRMEEKKAAEEEIIQKAQKKGKVRPETFFRLHFEGLQREEGLAERRRLKEKEEVSKLKAASIHRAPHNPGIFHRLYESGRRRTDEAPSSDVEDEQLLSASETEEATRAPSRPAATGRSNSRPRPAKESKTSPEESALRPSSTPKARAQESRTSPEESALRPSSTPKARAQESKTSPEESALRPSSTPKARAQDTRTPEAEEAPPQTKQRSARPSSAPAPRAAKRAASPEKPAKRAASPGKAAKRAASPEKPAKQVASPEKTAKRAASPEKAAKRAASQEKAASAAPAAPASTASPATSSRSKAARVPPGERTGSPSLEKVKEGHRPGQSHEKEMESLQSLRKRSTRSSFGEPSPHKRRSLAAELFGDDDDDWGIEQPLPSHSSHADVWGAMTDFVSWDKEAE